MSRKSKKLEEPFSPEQLERLEHKGDKEVQLQRQKEGIFQRYHARRDAQDIAKQVRWKRRAGVAIVIVTLVLLLLWIISWLMSTIGDLVISVDRTAMKKGISISQNEDGSDPSAKLSATMVKDVTNISYLWLPATLDIEADGSHNGRNYLAYTFYLTNNGKETLDYDSVLKSVRKAKDADEAIRVMVYRTRSEGSGEDKTFPENTSPQVYAKENRAKDENGDPQAFEKIYEKVIPDSYTKPTAEEIKAAEKASQSKEEVDMTEEEIVIQPFVDEDVIFTSSVEGLEPGQTDRYTIVMWIEGDDPEAVDIIRGGFVKMNWFFNVEGEEL